MVLIINFIDEKLLRATRRKHQTRQDCIVSLFSNNNFRITLCSYVDICCFYKSIRISSLMLLDVFQIFPLIFR